MEAPVYLDGGDEIGMKQIPVCNILTLVQYLFDKHGVVCPQPDVSKFWDHAHRFFGWRDHPAIAAGIHVPLGLHGDECRYTSSAGLVEKIVALSLNVLLWCPKSSRNSRFVLVAIRESECVGRRTMFPILEYVQWAFNILFTGIKPSTGFCGGELPKNLDRTAGSLHLCRRKHKFCLVEVRGDWAWHCFLLALKNRWTSKNICFRCHARSDRSEAATLRCSYLDFSDTAEWMEHQVSHVEFINDMLHPGPICTLDSTSAGVKEIHVHLSSCACYDA